MPYSTNEEVDIRVTQTEAGCTAGAAGMTLQAGAACTQAQHAQQAQPEQAQQAQHAQNVQQAQQALYAACTAETGIAGLLWTQQAQHAS